MNAPFHDHRVYVNPGEVHPVAVEGTVHPYLTISGVKFFGSIAELADLSERIGIAVTAAMLEQGDPLPFGGNV